MNKLWMRKVELIVGGKSFNGDDFEIDFKIPFSTKSEPDISEITIYNLSKNTIETINNQGNVILNAGYEGDIGTILKGTLEKSDSYWQGVDKVTKLFVGDGSSEWREKKINKTYKAGTTASYILKDLANNFGLEIGDIQVNKDKTYKRGRSFTSTLQSALKQVAKDTETKLYLDSKKLYLRPPNKGTPTGFILNSDTGLIDSPQKSEEEDEKGNKKIYYTVKSLLNHRITCDSILQIESRSVNGIFRVVEGTYNGDFNIECKVEPA